MGLGDTARLIAELELRDKFSGPALRITSSLGRMERGFGQIGRGAGQVGAGLDRLGTRAALAAAGGLAAVITKAASFEQAFVGITKTVDETATTSFADLNEALREMARTIPVSFEELAGIGEAGGALGIAADDLEAFIDVVARLAVSTNLSSESAATALGQLGNILHLEGADFEDFADSLVALGNAGASTEAEIVDIAARFAAAGTSAGLTKEEILALASATASMGINVEAAGSSLSRIFNSVATNIGTSSEKAVAFADTIGLSAAEFREAWERDAVGTFQDFLVELGKLDQFEQADLLKKIGITGVRDINAVRLMSQNIGLVNEQLAISEEATGELRTESQKFFDTTSSRWKVTLQNVQDVAATIGAELLPIVNDLTKEFVDFLQLDTSQGGIRQFAKDLAGGIRGVVDTLKGTDFSGLIEGMKIAGQVASTAFGMFRSLPPQIQALAVGAIALNKVSGGAVGQIAGGLAGIVGGVIKVAFPKLDIFSRGSPVNPMFVSVIGGIPGIPGVPGGKPDAASRIPSWLKLLGWSTVGLGVGVAAGAAAADAAPAPFGPVKVRSVEGEAAIREGADAIRDQGKSDATTIKDAVVRQQRAAQANTALENDLLRDAKASGIGNTQAIVRALRDNKPPTAAEFGEIMSQDRKLSDQQLIDALVAQGKPLTADQLITALATTSEFGRTGVGTTIEQGKTTGEDPFGQVALALFQLAKNPMAPDVLYEIKNHIIAAEEIQAAYLADGNVNAARETQVTIDGLHELIGSEDANTATLDAAIRSTAGGTQSYLSNIQNQSYLQSGKLDALNAKDFSLTANITIPVSTYVNASLVAEQVRQQQISVGFGSGHGGPIPIP